MYANWIVGETHQLEIRSSGQPDDRSPEPLGELLRFWQSELPALGREYGLRALFDWSPDCPICDGAGIYHSPRHEDPVECFCRIQELLQERSGEWQRYNSIPKRYQNLRREHVLVIEDYLPNTQKERFSAALRAANHFTANPQGNLFFSGTIGSGRTVLAAYIANNLSPIPAIYVSARQLVDTLLNAQPEHVESLYTVPVLIIDDFSLDPEAVSAEAISQLYDLVYYRWGEMLPIIVTSTHDFDTLEQAFGTIFDRLRQDAQIFAFDWRPVPVGPTHFRRPLDLPASKDVMSMMTVNRCGWLGVEYDPGTWVSLASTQNYCHRPGVPQAVDLGHQTNTCLTRNHQNCPVFQHEGIWLGDLPDTFQRDDHEQIAVFTPSREGIVAAVGILLTLGGLALWLFLLFGDRLVNLLTLIR